MLKYVEDVSAKRNKLIYKKNGVSNANPALCSTSHSIMAIAQSFFNICINYKSIQLIFCKLNSFTFSYKNLGILFQK